MIMRMRFLAILGLFGVLLFSACSSATQDKTNDKTAASTNGNGNTTVMINGIASAGPASVGANIVNAQPAGNIQVPVESVQRKLEQIRKSGGTSNVDPAVLAEKNARPAPENSTFTSYLADAGYEVRTFKNHPKLRKVEKRIAADGTQTLKIFMRDGRVVELPGLAINPLSIAPSAHILQAVAGSEAQKAVANPAPGKKSAN